MKNSIAKVLGLDTDIKIMKTCTLKNGEQIFHLNGYETEFLYQEIFENKVYLKNGITVSDESVIVDLGANIGLFALFMKKRFPGCEMYLIEPSPVLCEVIEANVRNLGGRVTLIQAGISNRSQLGDFTYYPSYSVISGFNADADQDRRPLRAGVKIQVAKMKLDADSESRFVERLVSDKLAAPQTFKVKQMTLSDLIKQEKIERIDLLKIDVERCELEALEGLNDYDWKKIRQIAMEVHDTDGSLLTKIRQLLLNRNFKVLVEQEENFKATGVNNLYATSNTIP